MLDQVFVYHPAEWEDRDWALESGLPLEDVWFQASDGVRVFGWHVPAPRGKRDSPVLLWCHGNAGNMVHRLDNLAYLHRLGLAVFLFDYRGYGRSKGRPTEEGLYRDALAAHAYLTEQRQVSPNRLVIFGRSLGAAVAGAVASQRPAAGLILESSFPSVESMARAHYFGLPLHWLLGAQYDLLGRLRHIQIPILVIHGDQDEIVPIKLGRQVYEAVQGPKSFYLVRGADHNALYWIGGQPYFQKLKAFIHEVTNVAF